MEKKAGIWIDTQKAFIVTLDKSGHATKTILSQIETKVRIAGESKDLRDLGNSISVRTKRRRIKESKRKEISSKQFLKKSLSPTR
ncbi:MAG: hypothetical protein IPL67_17975 [Ignavibacteria bacterium]|nr:hypothetical protein [Ignavibacteria bacterium]